MMMRLLAACLACALLTGLTPQAGAQQSPPPQVAAPHDDSGVSPQRNGPGRNALAACRGDMEALCADVPRGGGRKIQCLKDNQAKLSPSCRESIQAVLDKVGAGRQAKAPAGTAGPNPQHVCKADIATLCAGVEKGHGRIQKCLKEYAAKLSAACQSARADQKAQRQMLRRDVKSACGADLHTLCGPAVKGPEALQCLREKQSQASPGCQQALAQLPIAK